LVGIQQGNRSTVTKSGEGAHDDEGKVGEKIQELTGVTGVAGVEVERG
jgi:hypothetical protein